MVVQIKSCKIWFWVCRHSHECETCKRNIFNTMLCNHDQKSKKFLIFAISHKNSSKYSSFWNILYLIVSGQSSPMLSIRFTIPSWANITFSPEMSYIPSLFSGSVCRKIGVKPLSWQLVPRCLQYLISKSEFESQFWPAIQQRIEIMIKKYHTNINQIIPQNVEFSKIQFSQPPGLHSDVSSRHYFQWACGRQSLKTNIYFEKV